MLTTFTLLRVNPEKGLPIVIGCILVPLVLAWIAGQYWPTSAQVSGTLFNLALTPSSLLLGYRLLKKHALETVLVNLNPADLTVTYASGLMVRLPLTQLVR